jgi:hypothetical protein
MTKHTRQVGGSTLHARHRILAAGAVLALVSAFAVVEIIHAQGGFSPATGSVPPLPSAKATVLARSQQALATAQAAPRAPKTTTGIPPTAAPTATLTAGITYEKQGPFSNSDFSIYDVYRGPVTGRWVVVYAGTSWINFPKDGLGALRVYTIDGGFTGTFDAPDGSGDLNITGVSGATLQITSDKGTQLTFDMATDTWGNS